MTEPSCDKNIFVMEINDEEAIQEVKDELKDEASIKVSVPLNFVQFLSSINCSLRKICCICLLPNENVSSLFSAENNENLRLVDMLKSFASIQIFTDDMTTQLCDSCKSEIIHCYNFKIKCEKSNRTLQSLMKSDFTQAKTEGFVEHRSYADNIKATFEKYEAGVKKEGDEDVTDVQYLEDIYEIDSDNEALYILTNSENVKTQLPLPDSEEIKEDLLRERKISKKHTQKNITTCSFCEEKFDNHKSLLSHIKCKHNEEEKASYPCKQCKEAFGSEHDLQVHLSIHTAGPRWICLKCSKEFKARSMLRRHLQRHMEVKRYACASCGKSFSELHALRRHWRVHTGEGVEKKHVCHICDKRYSERSLLEAHVSRHTSERPHVCAVCGRTFPSLRLLTSHRRVHDDRKPYACRYCDRRFRHESTRNTHHRTHTGEKPYVCSICGKTFIQNTNLCRHMRTHTGEKPYSCSRCDKKFASGSVLKAHIQTHTGEKPYACKVCGKRFARKELSAHLRVHSGERPYACSACPKRFLYASRLRDHARVHTGEKPFECASCTKKFSTKSELVKHVKRHQQKKKEKRKVTLIRQTQPPLLSDTERTSCSNEELNREVPLEIVHDMPLEVSEELVVQDEGEVLIMDNGQNDVDYRDGHIFLDTGTVNDNVNLVEVNEGGVSISASSSSLEGTTVKLYQLDQSLVQIHSAGGQVTISKITSKMTANF